MATKCESDSVVIKAELVFANWVEPSDAKSDYFNLRSSYCVRP